MKTILVFAAALAALTTASVANASERTGGHWEWKTRPSVGPNKPNLPTRVRVWVKNDLERIASCDCPMMKTNPADCMMDMQGKNPSSSKG